MKEKTKGFWKGIGIAILAYIAIGVISLTAVSIKDSLSDKGGFKISELPDDVGIGFCTASVNTKILYCDEPRVGIYLYNITQERLDELLEDCVNAELDNAEYCIGETLSIYG